MLPLRSAVNEPLFFTAVCVVVLFDADGFLPPPFTHSYVVLAVADATPVSRSGHPGRIGRSARRRCRRSVPELPRKSGLAYPSRRRAPGGWIMREYRLFIGGEFVDSANGDVFETTNPSTGEVVAKVAR